MELVYSLEIVSVFTELLRIINDSAMRLYLDNPMFKIVLAFIPAILGIAYPIILQLISRLNDQFNSTHIIQRFKKEKLHIAFIWSLRISVFLTLLCFVLSEWVFILAFISVSILLVIFFFYLTMMLNYQSGSDLFNIYNKRLNLKDKSIRKYSIKRIYKKKQIILAYWHPIVDLLLYAIKNNDRKLESDIKTFFMYPAFSFIKEVEQKDKEILRFPDEFYNRTYDIVSTYVQYQKQDYYSSIETFVGSIFFTNPYFNKNMQYLHSDTLSTIWRNLTLLVEHGESKKVISYWGAAHQNFSFFYNIPSSEYDDDYNETINSKVLRNKVENQRAIFLQFHTVLAAYIMYKSDYLTLKKIWFYTQSQPADYVLMPKTMTEIFGYYFLFNDYHTVDIPISYWFKNLDFDAMNNEEDVKLYIRKYAALLFIKQWKTPGQYGYNSLTLPKFPTTQSEKSFWADKLFNFKYLVEQHLNDKELLSALGLDGITKKWCEEKGIEHTPVGYVDFLIEKLKSDIKTTLEVAELDPSKVESINTFTLKSLSKIYNSFIRITGKDILEAERSNKATEMEVIRGTHTIVDKDGLVKDPKIETFGIDGLIASAINQNYYHHVSTKFLLNHSIKYTVSNGEMFLAIENLELKSEHHVIISFGVNLSYYKDYLGASIDDGNGDIDYFYNSIPIYHFDYNSPLVNNSLFILEKKSLPMIKHRDWSEIKDLPKDAAERWKQMDLIDESLHLYSRIIELNKHREDVESYIKQGMTEEELKNKVKIEFDFLGYCWFKKDIKMIMINENNVFQEGGIKTQLYEIPKY